MSKQVDELMALGRKWASAAARQAVYGVPAEDAETAFKAALEAALTPGETEKAAVLQAIVDSNPGFKREATPPAQTPLTYSPNTTEPRHTLPDQAPTPVVSTPAQTPPPRLTDEDVQRIATNAVRRGRLSWLGFKKDDNGSYTIPVLSQSNYQLARAIETAVRAQLGIKDQEGGAG
jgi:hypothetical protein